MIHDSHTARCSTPSTVPCAPIRVCVGSLLLLTVLSMVSARAGGDVSRGQRIWHDKAGCHFCHGWAGDGMGGFHHPGHAPPLRGTRLDRDQIRTLIQCGRPGTPMPYFDRFAYTDKRCYGMTATEVGELMPDRATTTLQPDEIDALADYVAERIKGAGPVTHEQCVAYFGGATSRCDMYAAH